MNESLEAIQAEWAARAEGIRTEQEQWFRRTVRAGASIQSQMVPWLDWKEGTRARGQDRWVLALPLVALRKLERLSFEPKSPAAVAGHRDDLVRTARRLHAVVNDLEVQAKGGQFLSASRNPANAEEEHKAACGLLRALAVAYSSIEGGYYSLTPPKSKELAHVRHATKGYRENWDARRTVAQIRGDASAVWACDMALQGFPEQFTDFYIEPLFVLEKRSGTRVRMLNVHTRRGELFGFNSRRPRTETNRPLELTGEFSKSPTCLREWLADRASGNWGTGEREWQAVCEDLNFLFAWKNVKEVTSWGWNAESNAWFAGDCAITENGEILRANKHGYYRIGRDNYMSSERDREGQQFHHGAPMWHPDEKLEQKAVSELWEDVFTRLEMAVGNREAYMALGLAMAYGAAPEIFRDYRCFPGLWVHGQKGQGKGWLARWLMHIWGFNLSAGVTLESSSAVGTALVVQQYSNLPVWFDEFQTTSQDLVVKMLKGFFDRSAGAKKLTDLREINTSPIVIGQATSSDSATRSRYPHVQMSAERRLPRPGPNLTAAQAEKDQRANFEWLKENMARFWWLGRWVLEHRREYVEQVQAAIAEWEADEGVSVVRDERTRMVYGVVYAGFAGFHRLIMGLPKTDERTARWLASFRLFLVGQAQTAVSEVRQQNELERFWQKVMGCFTMGGFGDTPDDLRRFFKPVRAGSLDRPPGVLEESTQRGAIGSDGEAEFHWTSWNLRIEPAALFEAVSRYVRQQNETLPLKQMDCRAQMSTMPYWVPSAAKARFDGAPVRYWEISLDHFTDLGYRQCSDEEVALAMKSGDEDPRLGPIYRIVNKLRSLPKDPS
jgi:hypothetical protein